MARDDQESSRNLLEELEGGWDTPKPPPAKISAALDAAAEKLVKQAHAGPAKSEEQLRAELDAAAERLVESLAMTDIDLDQLDSAWNEDDDADEPEESEPELPDERLDPEAYAAAKKAREERAEARRAKKKMKLEAKRMKQKARAEAIKRKQKAKKPRATNAPKTVAKEKAKAEAKQRAKDVPASKAREEGDDDAPASERVERRKPPVARAKKGDADLDAKKAPPWRAIAIAVAVFLAAALLFSMLRR